VEQDGGYFAQLLLLDLLYEVTTPTGRTSLKLLYGAATVRSPSCRHSYCITAPAGSSDTMATTAERPPVHLPGVEPASQRRGNAFILTFAPRPEPF
jgi:hypothetical protein